MIIVLKVNFYPRPPRGGRHAHSKLPPADVIFLSTPSARRATSPVLCTMLVHTDFYPRPPRGGRRGFVAPQHIASNISIHALREEGDCSGTPSPARSSYFYPRPPRGGRPRPRVQLHGGDLFLSTPSARRATSSCASQGQARSHFYPRPPRGGRHCKYALSSCIK